MDIWSSKPCTNYKYLHIFGCPTYFHVRESKLDSRAKTTLFMGFSTSVNGYRFWCPDVKKFVVSRDVTFDETTMVNQNKNGSESDVTKTMSGSKYVELLKTLVVPVKSDDSDTSPTIDFDDEDERNEEEASTPEPSQ
ncbi:unnamed protein product [Prunus brigantina]